MAGVLVLDPSATLRYVVGQVLRKRLFEVTVCNDFEAGAQLLRADTDPDGEGRFRGVVLGWPEASAPGRAELLDILGSPPLSETPAVVLSMDPTDEAREWVTERRSSAWILLDHFEEVPDVLEALIQEPVVPPPVEVPKPLPGEGIRVMFVDDSQSARTFISKLLKSNGYQIETASSADEALELAGKHEFDIAIIDYFMPGGNGDELCRRLKEDERTAQLMTAIFTSEYLDEVIKDALEAGASDCMFKSEADELFLARLSAMSRTIRTRRTVEQESRRLEGILSSVGEGVYGVDTTGRITFVNPAARGILGYSGDHELIGASAHALFHYANLDGSPVYPETCFLQQAYELGDELTSWEATFWNAERKAVPVECTVYPLRIEGLLRGSVVAFRDISGRKAMEEELKWQINHDHLTKLLNRHFFEQELQRELQRLRHNRREETALLYIDLDRFKYINDTAGHSAGDQLLIEVARQLQARLRNEDLLARLGGDEFAVILRNVRRFDIASIADTFRQVLQNSLFNFKGKNYKVNGSIGVSVISWETQSADEALANADIACHIAKQQGRNQIHVYDAGNDEKLAMDMELGWSNRLHEALEQDQFLLYFQPILPTDQLSVEPGGGAVEPLHYEVLLRLPGRGGKLILPDAFMPTAERFNLIQRVDCWVVAKALERLAECCGEADGGHLAINLSGPSMSDRETRSQIRELLNRAGRDPSRIIFEITETAAIENVEAAKEMIGEFKSLGCHFALDDFGSGFSSFSHLKHLDVDYIKIDGDFVSGMARSEVDRAIVRSINEIAHALGKRTIAEFVEGPEQIRILKEYGVDYCQGHGLGIPTRKLGGRRILMEAGSGGKLRSAPVPRPLLTLPQSSSSLTATSRS